MKKKKKKKKKKRGVPTLWIAAMLPAQRHPPQSQPLFPVWSPCHRALKVGLSFSKTIRKGYAIRAPGPSTEKYRQVTSGQRQETRAWSSNAANFDYARKMQSSSWCMATVLNKLRFINAKFHSPRRKFIVLRVSSRYASEILVVPTRFKKSETPN